MKYKTFEVIDPEMKFQFIIGFTLVMLLGSVLLLFPMEITSDGTRYLIGAKFISEGMGYKTFGFDSQEIIPQIGWPPMLSFLVASVMRVSGWNEIYTLKSVNYLSLVLYYLSFFWLATLLFLPL